MRPVIAFDCTPLIGQTGGVGTFVRGAVGALLARGDHDLVAYALSWRSSGTLHDVVPDGARVVDRRLPASALLRTWEYSAWPWAELWTGPVDVVHGSNFVVPPTRRAAAVATVHDLTAVRYPEMCTAVSLRYPALVQRAVARGAHVHVPSDYVAGEVIELLGVPRDRVGVVPHGVDHVTPLDVVPDDPPYVLALGTVEPRKDYPGLVRAFEGVAAIHTNVRLVIAGRDGWGVDATDAAIAASPFRARIERRQVDGDAARREILARAHVLVYPSVYEGFGLPPLEAMAAGTPVVATAAGAVPEVIGDAALLVPVGDVDALAAAITKVLDDESTCAALRTSGSERAARFTWKACAAGLVDLYARAVEAAGKT